MQLPPHDALAILCCRHVGRRICHSVKEKYTLTVVSFVLKDMSNKAIQHRSMMLTPLIIPLSIDLLVALRLRKEPPLIAAGAALPHARCLANASV